MLRCRLPSVNPEVRSLSNLTVKEKALERHLFSENGTGTSFICSIMRT